MVAIFENCKEGNVNVNRKNSGVDTNRKNVKDDEGDDEGFAMNTESIIDFDANIMNSRKADKSDGDTTSALFSKVRKKSIILIEILIRLEKELVMLIKMMERSKRELVILIKMLKVLHPTFLKKLEKMLVINILGIIYLFFLESLKRESVIIL